MLEIEHMATSGGTQSCKKDGIFSYTGKDWFELQHISVKRRRKGARSHRICGGRSAGVGAATGGRHASPPWRHPGGLAGNLAMLQPTESEPEKMSLGHDGTQQT